MTGSFSPSLKKSTAGSAKTPNSFAICLSSILTKLIPAPPASSSMCSISASTLGHCWQSLLSANWICQNGPANFDKALTEKDGHVFGALLNFSKHFSVDFFDVVVQLHVLRVSEPIQNFLLVINVTYFRIKLILSRFFIFNSPSYLIDFPFLK